LDFHWSSGLPTPWRNRGGFVEKAEDFDAALNRGLHASPIHEVLVEQSIMGWKEFELELLRDGIGNVIIICSIENFDPWASTPVTRLP